MFGARASAFGRVTKLDSSGQTVNRVIARAIPGPSRSGSVLCQRCWHFSGPSRADEVLRCEGGTRARTWHAGLGQEQPVAHPGNCLSSDEIVVSFVTGSEW